MMISKVSNKLFSVFKCLREHRYISALYITGDKAQKNFAVLTPVVDFDTQLASKSDLRKNFEKRCLKINVDQLEKRWIFLKDLKEHKMILEQTRAEIGKSISNLLKTPDSEQEIEKLKLHAKVIKEDLRNLKEYFNEIEEETMIRILDLPNNLHDRTPEESVQIHSYSQRGKGKSESHMNIANQLGYLKYYDNFTCYLLSDAATFEQSIQNFFRKSLLDVGFIQFSNSNFCRSIVIEGCGKNYLKDFDVITLEESDVKGEVNRLHLCGSASLPSFMSYFTKHSVNENLFPMKLFSLGKCYKPVQPDLAKNLFSLSQETMINVFIATLADHNIFDSIVEQVYRFYECLGYHFQLVLSPANELDKSESLRVSIQMYSSYELSYVEVGNISFHGNYISQRLLFNYNSQKIRKYPNVISGTLVNVPKLLGCVLENNSLSNSPLLSDLLRRHLF